MMHYILERLREGPTWAGIAAFLAGAVSINIDAALMAQIQQVGMSVAGLLLMVLPNKTGGGGSGVGGTDE
jgi:hypothetical protein